MNTIFNFCYLNGLVDDNFGLINGLREYFVYKFESIPEDFMYSDIEIIKLIHFDKNKLEHFNFVVNGRKYSAYCAPKKVKINGKLAIIGTRVTSITYSIISEI